MSLWSKGTAYFLRIQKSGKQNLQPSSPKDSIRFYRKEVREGNDPISLEESVVASVLITDDEDSILEYFEDILYEVGFDVYTARDGQEAIEMMEGLKPDIMLADLMMPRLGGIQLIDSIRAVNNNIPIVVITGVGNSAEEEKALKAGANVVLPKPLQIEKLEEVLLSLVGKNIHSDHDL